MKIDAAIADLLARRDFFSEEMKKKLLDKGFSEEEIHDHIEKWKSRGYLSDHDLALRFIQKYKASGHGPSVIRSKLFLKCRNPELLSLVSQVQFDQKEEIVKIMAKRFAKADLKEDKQKRRFFSYLLRKGFSMDFILQVFREIE